MVASNDSSLIDSTKPDQTNETVSKITNDLPVDESVVDKNLNEKVIVDETINETYKIVVSPNCSPLDDFYELWFYNAVEEKAPKKSK